MSPLVLVLAALLSQTAQDAGPVGRPTYVDPDAFTSEPATVGQGLSALPGTLCLPRGDGPWPAVVLVHGSGPNDRDETIGPNKPFRDLGAGLAARGIATLRYEKRTRQHGLALALFASRLTVEEETIKDAVAAVGTLARDPRIDPARIAVLGHSLGGYVAPRIVAAEPRIAGAILMAANARPLEDLLLDQFDHLHRLDGTVTDGEARQFARLTEQVALVRSPGLTVATPASKLPLGIPAAYWLDLKGYDPAEQARTQAAPLLILQGGRDYQVTVKDYERWQAVLKDRAGVTFRLYPGLDHLMRPGDGVSKPADYLAPGHVDPAVIDDVATWLKTLEPRRPVP